MATLEQLIIFFLLIGVGVIARKVGVITPGNTPQLTSLVFNFAMPAIILSGITTEQPHSYYCLSSQLHHGLRSKIHLSISPRRKPHCSVWLGGEFYRSCPG